jgi:hypothetical protein
MIICRNKLDLTEQELEEIITIPKEYLQGEEEEEDAE